MTIAIILAKLASISRHGDRPPDWGEACDKLRYRCCGTGEKIGFSMAAASKLALLVHVTFDRETQPGEITGRTVHYRYNTAVSPNRLFGQTITPAQTIG